MGKREDLVGAKAAKLVVRWVAGVGKQGVVLRAAELTVGVIVGTVVVWAVVKAAAAREAAKAAKEMVVVLKAEGVTVEAATAAAVTVVAGKEAMSPWTMHR